jgi:hypothetical protein
VGAAKWNTAERVVRSVSQSDRDVLSILQYWLEKRLDELAQSIE